MIKRRKTRTITAGNVKIGSGHPVSIQSMTKTDTGDVDATVRQINDLQSAGCEIVRAAVKDLDAAKAISSIKKEITLPLVADIHFDHKLALEAIERGADKVRINPGNIEKFETIDKIIDAAGAKKIPIRIGVNSGSLPDEFNSSMRMPERMVKFALKYISHFQKRDFNDIVISLKASEAPATVSAYRKIAEECDYPLHLGVTAAGLPEEGIIKSSIGIGALAADGIGDTVRVSLTGDPVAEVITAKRILASVGVRHFGPQIISCPTCGRCQVDLVHIVQEADKQLKDEISKKKTLGEKQLVIAVMGCEVNGPGEAKHADIGIAFGKGKGVIFKHGEIVKTVGADVALKELLGIIEEEL